MRKSDPTKFIPTKSPFQLNGKNGGHKNTAEAPPDGYQERQSCHLPFMNSYNRQIPEPPRRDMLVADLEGMVHIPSITPKWGGGSPLALTTSQGHPGRRMRCAMGAVRASSRSPRRAVALRICARHLWYLTNTGLRPGALGRNLTQPHAVGCGLAQLGADGRGQG